MSLHDKAIELLSKKKTIEPYIDFDYNIKHFCKRKYKDYDDFEEYNETEVLK